ncbi:MAG: type I restriction endonuclease subunit R [Proteobacteria bacterium]|nr:type I restriction endonuclease subunit R [Pseudomonadota bacterium]NOG60054.1 type I restriction endonuclease subunit R [Pseudomonadota bacterium]
MPNFISEDDIEQAILQRLQHSYGFDVLDCFTQDKDDLKDGSNRSDKRDVIFSDRLKTAALKLNSYIPESAIDEAIEIVMAKRHSMSTIAANKELDELIRDGVPVEYEDENGRTESDRVKLIDFNNTKENEFLAVSQLWIKGERRFRRPDILLYINGIPLVFIELKNSNVKLRSAYDDNLTNYQEDIPQLFHTNAFCILSNAIETKVGSFNSQWEFFFNWLRVENEKEKVNRDKIEEEGTSVEFVINGLCNQKNLLDYIENFIIYHKDTQKIIAQNHQFLGVNNAFDVFGEREKKKGKLGVFWHTQGSGKSFSMIFYVRKILRKVGGHFTFLVVTDRDDLDGQIYRNFLNTETVTKAEAAQPKNSEQLRDYLGKNKRLIFSLIHKFRWPKGKKYPELSDRDDIVVIVDEAHRTQYKSLAENMRAGLTNAQFLAFTGTPLLGRKRKTNEWFGDYVSEYNFQQSMDDGATVPLFYQKRVPEVSNQNEDLSEEFYEILESENLDEAQQEKLENKYATEMEVIKRDDRLDTIARDIAYHFPRRGYLGKGMVISVDKFTAVKMYDKVQYHWKEELKKLRKQIKKTVNEFEKARLKKIIDYMHTVEMAVIVSEEAKEDKKFEAEGLDIKPHRVRMEKLDEHGHDVEYNFKDPEHELQLVFVCAMWLTGFDAPTVSTLYLDKPQKDHTLMQTIARANRVTSYLINGRAKMNGEIIDYYNVFRNMKKALKDYGLGDEGTDKAPVQEKEVLFELLDKAINEGMSYAEECGIDLKEVMGNEDIFSKVSKFNEYADILLGRDEWRKTFNVYENTVSSLYEACKPEILGQAVVRDVAVFQYLRGVIDSVIQQADIDKVAVRVSELLDESIVVDDDKKSLRDPTKSPQYQIIKKGKNWDLSKIDFDKLKEDFKKATYKNIEISDLKVFVEKKIEQMLNVNKTRRDFSERLQDIINRYNSGGTSNEDYFNELLKFAESLRTEEERSVREGLSDDELEIYDLLKKEKMTKKEEQKVKLAAKALLHRLLDEQPKVLVQDWYKDEQTRQTVQSEVARVLDESLPESYSRKIFKEKCDNLYEMIFDYASQGKKWVA